MAKARKIKLKIVFDSNIIHNAGTNYLASKAANDLIDRYKNVVDLDISWHLPEVVLHERTFQLRTEISKLLSDIKKIEKVFGMDLKVDAPFIENHVNGLIKKQIEDKKLSIIHLDLSKVKWPDLVQDACFRRPPFEVGDKEKGFKDALIMESLMQLIENSPVSPSVCRIVFVCNDNLLSETVEKKITLNKNVKVLKSLNDLENMINILLTSEINEHIIKEISETVSNMFFTEDDKSTIFYNLKLKEKILKDYVSELKDVPSEGEKRKLETWWIGGPVFVKKVGQKVFWKNEVTVDSELVKSVFIMQSPARSTLLGTYAVGVPTSTFNVGMASGFYPLGMGASSFLGSETKPIESSLPLSEMIVKKGKSKFEINWITTVSVTKKVKFFKLESIAFLETIWEEA